MSYESVASFPGSRSFVMSTQRVVSESDSERHLSYSSRHTLAEVSVTDLIFWWKFPNSDQKSWGNWACANSELRLQLAAEVLIIFFLLHAARTFSNFWTCWLTCRCHGNIYSCRSPPRHQFARARTRSYSAVVPLVGLYRWTLNLEPWTLCGLDA